MAAAFRVCFPSSRSLVSPVRGYWSRFVLLAALALLLTAAAGSARGASKTFGPAAGGSKLIAIGGDISGTDFLDPSNYNVDGSANSADATIVRAPSGNFIP